MQVYWNEQDEIDRAKAFASRIPSDDLMPTIKKIACDLEREDRQCQKRCEKAGMIDLSDSQAAAARNAWTRSAEQRDRLVLKLKALIERI